jgi:hypothetical protein
VCTCFPGYRFNAEKQKQGLKPVCEGEILSIQTKKNLSVFGIKIRHPKCLKKQILILDCEAIGTAATPGLFCQPQVLVKMIVEKQMECRLAGETEVL